MLCFPISTLKPAWRQLSSEALLAANNPRLSIPFPSGMVPTCRSWPGWGRASSVPASQPAPFLHPRHNLVELKKKNKKPNPKQTTSKPSLFLLFPCRARMPGNGLAYLHHWVLLLCEVRQPLLFPGSMFRAKQFNLVIHF